jgi:translation initiation factor IF-1
VSRDGQPVAVEATVLESLPHGLYLVAVEERRITAHPASGLGRNFVRLVAGDRVLVEVSPRDTGRGRIVRKVL